jgi:hypothetical protein
MRRIVIIQGKTMTKLRIVLAGIGLVGLALTFAGGRQPALADTCEQHYYFCVNKYNNSPKVCGCARAACQKAVGSKDAGPKWNHLPGVNACFAK